MWLVVLPIPTIVGPLPFGPDRTKALCPIIWYGDTIQGEPGPGWFSGKKIYRFPYQIKYSTPCYCCKFCILYVLSIVVKILLQKSYTKFISMESPENYLHFDIKNVVIGLILPTLCTFENCVLIFICKQNLKLSSTNATSVIMTGYSILDLIIKVLSNGILINDSKLFI
jgi:hypothetical protein